MDIRTSAKSAKPGRNEPCPCGSGRKYKQCCAAKEQSAASATQAQLSAANQRQAAIYLQRGAHLLNAGRVAQSLLAMKQAAKLSPNDPNIQHNLGSTYLKMGDFAQASAYLTRAVTLKPEFASAHYQLGMALEELGRRHEAVAAYARATALLRSLADAHLRRANLLLALLRPKEAVEAYRAAAAAAPNTSQGRFIAGRALFLDDRNAEAEVALRRALVLDPKNSDGHWLLGNILAQSGEFKEAAIEFEQAIALNPELSGAYYDLVRNRRISDADRPLVERMLAVVSVLRRSDQRALLHLALGNAFNDLGDYASAMSHLVEASRIRQAIAPFDRAAFGRRIDAIIAQFTPAFFAAHACDGKESELSLAIVGMPRSGTTLVEQIVSSHSEVTGAGELDFWMPRGAAFNELKNDSAVTERVGELAGEYLTELRRAGPDAARVTDKNPFNFLWAGLIHLVFPRATIIHCRRHPVDTCISVLSTYWVPGANFSTEPEHLVFYYRQYERLMAHWRTVLPPGRFVEVDYEALIANPEEESRRLVAACGLPWDPACLRPERNTRVVKTSSKWQVRQPIYATALDRWRRYEPWLGPLLELMTGAHGAIA
jgi:tetratricopeptide (TPR) repeat protein